MGYFWQWNLKATCITMIINPKLILWICDASCKYSVKHTVLEVDPARPRCERRRINLSHRIICSTECIKEYQTLSPFHCDPVYLSPKLSMLCLCSPSFAPPSPPPPGLEHARQRSLCLRGPRWPTTIFRFQEPYYMQSKNTLHLNCANLK